MNLKEKTQGMLLYPQEHLNQKSDEEMLHLILEANNVGFHISIIPARDIDYAEFLPKRSFIGFRHPAEVRNYLSTLIA